MPPPPKKATEQNEDNKDVENGTPSEDTPLIGTDNANDSFSSTEAETTQPWPSSFNRAMSLLASPRLGGVEDIERMTRSPLSTLPVRRYKRQDKNSVISPGSPWAPPALTKRHSEGAKRDSEADQYDNLDKAKAYRQNLLQQQVDTGIDMKQAKEKKDSHIHSPGMEREKQVDKMKKAEPEMTAVDGKSTVTQCVFNMSNCLMGVGMLGLPFSCKASGWLGGAGVLAIFGLMTLRTTILLGRSLNGDPRPGYMFDDSPFKSPIAPGSNHKMARMRKPIQSFPEIAREAFGDKGAIALATVLYFELFSCLSIFLISIGDHTHTLYPKISLTNHLIIISALLTVPTALLTTTRLLSYLSAVGTFSTIAVVASVFFAAAKEGDISSKLAYESVPATPPPYHVMLDPSGLPLALGLVAYCFSGHAIVPNIYTSMEKPQDFEKMSMYSYVVVMFACFLVGLSGYYMFGSMVDDQITLSLAQEVPGLGVQLLAGLMALTAFSKYVLSMFPLSLGIEEIVAPLLPNGANETTANMLMTSIRLSIIFLALLVAVFVPSFGFLCSLVGLICTVIVSVIFPAAAHWKLFGSRLPFWEKSLDFIFITVGTISAIVGTIATVTSDVDV